MVTEMHELEEHFLLCLDSPSLFQLCGSQLGVFRFFMDTPEYTVLWYYNLL